MNNLAGKRLLILGGNYSTKEVVRLAKEMGIYTIVASNTEGGDAKEIADETLLMDVSDNERVVGYIKKNHIDGVMTGASEFHILNMIRICQKAKLPCYATEEQWDVCQNKYRFKKLCKEYGVPHVPFFTSPDEVPEDVYPVILKPVDGCSARGITVCRNREELERAIPKALKNSPAKEIIIEKFIINSGITHSVRYIANNGELYCEAIGDRYVLDANNGKALITASAFYPSNMVDYYLKNIDERVKDMFKGIGLKDGALFMEGISTPEDGLMFYEMGLRISGGMTYKISEITNDVNELKMLIRHAITGSMCDEEDINRINPYLNGYATGSVTIPLCVGKISTIKGIEEIRQIAEVNAVIQYYHEGDELEDWHMSTLDQLLCRISIIAPDKQRLIEVIEQIKALLSVKDVDGREMTITSRLDEIVKDYSKDAK